jgi:glycine/D-amino acid oxidase-like deaminating enzyme
VQVLEQFTFANQLGSSAGVSRQFRIPYPQRYMVKLVTQSVPLWAELQALTPRPLMDKVGTLWFGDPAVHSTEGNIGEAEKALQAEGVPYTSLNAARIESQYNFRNLPSTYTGLFQADGASLNLRETIRTLLEWNRSAPRVSLLEDSPALHIAREGGVYHVRTPQGISRARKLVLTPGPFPNSLFELLGFQISATWWCMASAYYRKTQPDIQYPTWFVFQKPVGDNGNQFYGFPEVDWNNPGYIRVASDFVIQPLTDPGQRSLIPNPRELAYTAQWVRDHMTGLDPEPCYTSTCLVSLSTIPNKEILLDNAPEHVPHHEDIVVCTPGWAGKFVPLIGRILSDLTLDGRTSYDISHFRLGHRFFQKTN